MDGCLAHRGPDRAGVWQQDSIGMGHQMLMTTPESLRERLPLVDDDGFVLTADARIDNRRELICTLGLGTRDDQNIGDGDLILAAYKRWREQTPEHLLGDFAFAIWDTARQTLFCARDPIGIRPFYYFHCSEKLFAFASEIKGVLACSDIPRRINERKVSDHLTRSFNDTRSTFYQDVVRLPAAHSLTVGRQGMQLRRYWSLDCTRDLRLAGDEEYAAAFREIFIDAVRCRTRSAFPVGSTLSGGLDSSSIACTANLLLPESQRPLRTFSAIFPSLSESELRRIDERPYIDAVLKSGRFDQTYVHADQASPLADWPSVSRHLGDACLAPNLYMHWGLYQAAAAKGVRVLLDGLDGDTTVSHGLGFLTDLVRAGRWMRLLSEVRALSCTNSVSGPIRSNVWQLGIRPLVPEPIVRTWRALRSASPDSLDVEPVISQRLMEKVRANSDGRESPHNGSLYSDARTSHWRALNSPLIPYAMEFADAASSAFAIEVRYPFFDRRLVEFCLAIPAEQKLRDGWTRSVMRRAVTGIVPAEIQWRTSKADLAPNFARGLFERDRRTIEDVVFSRLEGLREYVNVRAVQDAYARWVEQPKLHKRDALTLFAVTTLALWFEDAKVKSQG